MPDVKYTLDTHLGLPSDDSRRYTHRLKFSFTERSGQNGGYVQALHSVPGAKPWISDLSSDFQIKSHEEAIQWLRRKLAQMFKCEPDSIAFENEVFGVDSA